MASAELRMMLESAGMSVFRSRMPSAGVHRNARIPRPLPELPTTQPEALTPKASLWVPPESTPRLRAPVASQETAWVAPLESRDRPAAASCWLMANASLDWSPGNGGKRFNPAAALQIKARWAAPLPAYPAAVPLLLMATAALFP